MCDCVCAKQQDLLGCSAHFLTETGGINEEVKNLLTRASQYFRGGGVKRSHRNGRMIVANEMFV